MPRGCCATQPRGAHLASLLPDLAGMYTSRCLFCPSMRLCVMVRAVSVVFEERADLGLKFLVSLGSTGTTDTSGTHGVALYLTRSRAILKLPPNALPVFTTRYGSAQAKVLQSLQPTCTHHHEKHLYSPAKVPCYQVD